ncbi:MAG: rod shape-determining protein RodA [Bacillota bacterium]|nr:rod shape-determining protein RodA [Bacillota bacterium]
MVDLRKMLRHIDWLTVASLVTLIGVGLVFIASATNAQPVNGDNLHYVKRQAAWAAISLAALIIVVALDYELILRLAPWIYWANIALLGLVMVAGSSAYGAQRWLEIGPIRVQPSEFAKVAMIIAFASFLSADHRQEAGALGRLRDLLPSFAYVGLPMLLVFKQPDLGTSLVFVGITVGMLYMAGANPKALFGLIGGVLSLGSLAIYLHYRIGLWIPLREYQLRRLLSFLDPGSDLRQSGYHTHQSQIAIGSGRLFGKGLMAGSQNQLNFLPQRHTDFIFSVIGEEAGFAGAVLVLGLFLLLAWRGTVIAARAKDKAGSLLAIGVVSMLVFHVLVNVGMASGIMPVTGLPLPFISSGGSSLLANCVAVGLMLNVDMRRFKIYF